MARKRHRNKVSYTVMIISDSARKEHKEYHIKAGAVGIVTMSVFLLVVVLVCYVVYSSIILSDVQERSRVHLEQVASLKKANLTLEEEKQALLAEQQALLAEKQQLEGDMAALGDTLNQQLEAEQALVAEEEAAHLPKGFPLNGTAQLKDSDAAGEGDADDEDEDETAELIANAEWQEVIFLGTAGINVIASGSGTILAVEEDVGSGSIVRIDHGNGYVSVYRNGGNPVVKVGDEIEKGNLLFVIEEDNTELGYSISKDGAYIDPLGMLEING